MPLHLMSLLKREIACGGIILATLFVTACGNSKAKVVPTAIPALPKCSLSANDLGFGSHGAVSYHPVSISYGSLVTESAPDMTAVVTEAATAFDKGNGKQTKTSVAIDSSGSVLQDVASGKVAIGFSDFFASQRGNISGVTDTQIAAQSYTMIVSQDLQNSITDLSTEQLIGIYTGHITNWDQVGGPNRPITPFMAISDSITQSAFVHYVLGNATPSSTIQGIANSTDAMVTDIAITQGSIGYIPTSAVLNPSVASNLAPLCINGYGATIAAVTAGNYAFWNIEHAYTKTGSTTSTAQAFIAFIRSGGFQQNDFARNGFIGITSLPEAVIESHQAH